MNRLFSVFIISGLLLQLFSSQFYYAGFVLNQDFIKAELCEQKEITLNSCQGKCHLKKQIAKSEEQKENKNLPVKKGAEVLLYYVFSVNDFHIFYNITTKTISLTRFFTVNGFPTGVFHPPTNLFA